MKNKKTFVGIALLIVVLVLGIAYAAITDTLTITGSAEATASDENFKVVFDGEPTADTGVTATVTGLKSATMNVTGLTTAGQTKSATFTIKNNSPELKALVKLNTESITNEDFFEIETVVANPTTPLEVSGTTTATVTVKLIKTPIENVTGTINVELGATAVLGN